MSDELNSPESDGTASGGTGKKKALVGGAVGLGVVGMLMLGIVVINDDGDPLDEPDPELAEAVLIAGFEDDEPVGPDFGAAVDDPDTIMGDAAGDELVGGDGSGEGSEDVIPREEGSDILIGSDDNDDTLLGAPGDDVIDGDDNPADDDPLLGNSPTGLKRLCAEIEHSSPPGMEDTALSGVWVRGEVYGLAPGTWIWIEGPTLNGGEPTQIPVVDGFFEAPLGINSFGDHSIDRFELQFDDQPPVDLRPAVFDAIGGEAFPVGPDEGPVFGDECFDFEPLDLPPFGVEVVEPETAGEPDPINPLDLDTFFKLFATAHVDRDVEALWGSLHPVVPQAFGESTCRMYVDDTLGSIQSVEVVEVV
ncbi:MAG: hypothetical protein ACR2O6_01435, partial [Ilumatobacteraceae bacterium]